MCRPAALLRWVGESGGKEREGDALLTNDSVAVCVCVCVCVCAGNGFCRQYVHGGPAVGEGEADWNWSLLLLFPCQGHPPGYHDGRQTGQ